MIKRKYIFFGCYTLYKLFVLLQFEEVTVEEKIVKQKL